MSELSRVEDLLKTGVEEPVLPMSRLEAILRGEKITPQSRVEELLLQYNPSDILIEKRITENGTYFAVNDNADGYFKVVVDTPVVPPTVLDHLVETITTNGLHEYTPTHDGFDTAAITVAVPIPPEKILGTKTITENDTYDASDDSTEVTVTLDNPSIPDNSFIHVDISDIADVTKIVGKVRYTNTSTNRAFTVDISNIPTYTPSGSNPYQNMYRFDSYNAYVSLYISKDATGIFLYNMNEGWVRPVIYEFGYKETKQLDGYSQVTVNVQPTLDDITITENGTYTSEHDGFDEVTVNVSGGGGGQITPIPTSAFDTLVVNARYSTGSWDLDDGILSFDISEEDNSWTSFVSLRSIKKDFTAYKSLKFDVNLTSREGYSELAVIISPKYYNWGSSSWPGIFDESNKVVLYTTESGSYSIDTTGLAGGQYIYIIANTSDHEHRGNNYNGTIIGTVSNIKVEKLEITEYKQFRYCQFTSPARIDLPKLTQADSFDLDFECLTNYNDQSVFGTGGGSTKLHLTQYNNRWYTAANSGEVNFEGELLGRHVFTWNVYDSVNNLRASQFDGVTVVGNVETTADNQNPYLGYRSSDNHFNGVIYSYTVYRIIDGQRVDIMKLIPMRAYIEGTMAFEGFYDTVNDEWYTADGVVCGGGEAVADSHIYLMDGQVPGNQGTTYLEFDKPPVNGYYVISIYANNKSINNMVYFETGRNSDNFNFSPGSSGSYNCYIMWDNNKATLRVACNSGSWYTMHTRVTRVDNNYILNS